jgi:hypothetical protein
MDLPGLARATMTLLAPAPSATRRRADKAGGAGKASEASKGQAIVRARRPRHR